MERNYYDLSSAQRILFLSQKYTLHKQVNNICTSVLVNRELDLDILKKAITKAYERNDSLRIRIIKVDKNMKQYFEEFQEPVIDYLDFRGKTKEKMKKRLYKIAHKRISTFGKNMSKIYIMNSFDGKWGMYFVVSHFIIDSWGITRFFKDILEIYEALCKGDVMPPPLASYEKLLIEELNYKSTEKYKKDKEFFEKILSEKEPIFTHVNGRDILDKYRIKRKNPNLRYVNIFTLFTKANNVMLLFPKELIDKMEAYCEANKVPMQSLVILAYRSYCSKVNNNEKNISIHTVVARRGTIREKNTGGSRVHFMPFTTIFEESEIFKNACFIISEKQAAIYRHSEMDPLEIMSMWKKIFKIPEIGTYFSTALTYQPVKLVSGTDMRIETKWYGNGASGNPLYLTVMDGDGTGALKLYYEYQSKYITLKTVEKLHSYMMKVIETGISNDQITIGELLNLE